MIKPMTVAEFITVLKTHPQDSFVAFRMYSENSLLSAEDIKDVDLCIPRPDGWVENYRSDKPTQKYLLLPGN